MGDLRNELRRITSTNPEFGKEAVVGAKV